MGVQTWQVLAAVAALLILYAFSVELLGIPRSPFGFLTMVVFVGLGVVLGRVLSQFLS